MKLPKITILFLLIVITSFGQQIESSISAIDASLNTVKSSKKEYIQSITIESPSVIKISVDEIDNKGNNSNKSYVFNPADIKKGALKKVVKKDLIYVEVPTNQKLIKYTSDDNKISYINSFKIYATDINNARELISKIKESIPIAEQIANQRISFSTYQECMNWLENNIGNVTTQSWDISQNLQEKPDHPGGIEFHKTINSSKSSEKQTFILNLFTLNPKTLTFKIYGDLFTVFAETNKAVKTIKDIEYDIQENYTNKFTIACSGIEQARDLKRVLQIIIPLAEESFNNSIIPISSNIQGITELNKLTGSFSFNDNAFKHRFTGECILDYTKEYDNSDKTEISDFNFSLNDIDRHKINYNSKGAFLFVDIFTKNGEPYIKHTINGEDIKYEKTVRFYVSSIENAILLKQTINDLITLCAGDEEIDDTNIVSKENISENDNVTNDNLSSESDNKQILTYEEVKASKTKIKRHFNEYLAKRGETFKVGDKITLANPSRSNDTYVNVVFYDGISEMSPVGLSYKGTEAEIKKFKMYGSKRVGYHVMAVCKTPSGLNLFWVEIDDGIDNGELITSVLTREQAIDKLKESKELLDLGLLTNEEYNKLKSKLTPIIMGN